MADSPVQIGATSMGIINNFVYCAGGNNSGGSAAFYNTIWRYDVNTNSWAVDTKVLSRKRHWMARAIYNGGMYVLGGFDSTGNAVNTVEEIVPQGTGTSIDEEQNSIIPQEFTLYQNYPNPFGEATDYHSPSTMISWQSSIGGYQTLKVYDLLGKEVATLINEWKEPGQHSIIFNATNLTSGVYFYQLRLNGKTDSKKFVLLR